MHSEIWEFYLHGAVDGMAEINNEYRILAGKPAGHIRVQIRDWTHVSRRKLNT